MNRPLARSGLAALALTIGACGWTPSHPLERLSPEVSRANDDVDAGRAAQGAERLQGYISTGACEDGAMGTPAMVGERPSAAYDLGLALFGSALPADQRFGPRVVLTDEGAKKTRGAQVACALRLLRAFLETDGVEAELRRRARFLEGNLLAIDERYDESVAAYDKALTRSPAELGPDAGAAVDRDLAWNRAVVLAWREEAKRDAGAPDGGGESGDGGRGDGGSPEAGPGDAGAPEAGTPDAGSPDAGGDGGGGSSPPDAGRDAGQDAGNDGKSQQPDGGARPDAGSPPPPAGAMNDSDLLDRLARAPTLQREAIRRQVKQSRGLVDK